MDCSPPWGGQTALSMAMELTNAGVLDHYGVTLLGADCKAIGKAECRGLFGEAVHGIGPETPRSVMVNAPAEIEGAPAEMGLPAIIRPSFTLGGMGGGIACNSGGGGGRTVRSGPGLSPEGRVPVGESVIGWKGYGMEVVRDGADNRIVVCSMENIDPMGVHRVDFSATGGQVKSVPTAAPSASRSVGMRREGRRTAAAGTVPQIRRSRPTCRSTSRR